FQAEDGIRDYKVTGVQTCALPIFGPRDERRIAFARLRAAPFAEERLDDTQVGPDGGPVRRGRAFVGRERVLDPALASREVALARSEERRVGKEWRSRWWGRGERQK